MKAGPWVRADLAALFRGLDFEGFLSLGQDLVKASANGARRTSGFERGGRGFYLKVYAGVGWKELWKNWLQGKRPVVDALTEVRALERCRELGIACPRLAACGARGRNPARRRSFVVTEAIEDAERLSFLLARELAAGRAPKLRAAVARSLGSLARRLHGAALAHQDFHLDHFLARTGPGGELELVLLDLHRMLPRRPRSTRWRVKDLATLLASVRALAPTRSDRLRFARAYGLEPSDPLWARVERRSGTLRSGGT
jgi:heptose I phosphotransferase